MPQGIGINTEDPQCTLDVNGPICATSFSGDGSGLTGVPAIGGLITRVELNGTTLEVEEDEVETFTASLASLIDDADADPANEYNTGLLLNSNVLELSDGGV